MEATARIDESRSARRVSAPSWAARTHIWGLNRLPDPKRCGGSTGTTQTVEPKQVADDYARNTQLLAALKETSRQKASFTGEAVEVLASDRPDQTIGTPWILGQGRFLVITVTKGSQRINGTVFEAKDGTRFVVMPARTRKEVDAVAVDAGPAANVFAVRPSWSLPAKEWVAADTRF